MLPLGSAGQLDHRDIWGINMITKCPNCGDGKFEEETGTFVLSKETKGSPADPREVALTMRLCSSCKFLGLFAIR